MENIPAKTISNKQFDQQVEQIRLAYANLLKIHLQLYNKYKHLKIIVDDEKLGKYFHMIDHYLYDTSGRINWDNICQLLPSNIEKKIKNNYDMLSVNEIRLCCLLLFNVPYKDIADILPYTQQSAHSVAYKIKQKTGMNNIIENCIGILLCEKTV